MSAIYWIQSHITALTPALHTKSCYAIQTHFPNTHNVIIQHKCTFSKYFLYIRLPYPTIHSPLFYRKVTKCPSIKFLLIWWVKLCVFYKEYRSCNPLIMQSSPLPCWLTSLHHNTWSADHEAAQYAVFSTPLIAPPITPQYLECRSWSSSSCSLPHSPLSSLHYTTIPGVQIIKLHIKQFSPLPW